MLSTCLLNFCLLYMITPRYLTDAHHGISSPAILIGYASHNTLYNNYIRINVPVPIERSSSLSDPPSLLYERTLNSVMCIMFSERDV